MGTAGMTLQIVDFLLDGGAFGLGPFRMATHATRTAWLPWQPEEPTGPEALATLASSILSPTHP
jgi:hypothetical protein